MLVESVRIIPELKLQSSILHDNKLHIRQVFARIAVVEMSFNVSKAFNFLDEFEQRYLSTADGLTKVEEKALEVSDILSDTTVGHDYDLIKSISETL